MYGTHTASLFGRETGTGEELLARRTYRSPSVPVTAGIWYPVGYAYAECGMVTSDSAVTGEGLDSHGNS